MENKIPLNDAERIKGLRNDYKKVFESEEGKRVLTDLEKVCMYRRSTFNKDSHISAYQEGLRSVFLHITTIVNMDIEELERIIEENQKGGK